MLSRLPRQQLALLALLVVLGAGFAGQSPAFLAWRNFTNILLQSAPVAIVAVGMTLVVLGRGIDLSVGSVMSLATVVAVLVGGTHHEEKLATDTSLLVYPVALAVGLLLGIVNGAIIDRSGISPLVATLGTLALYRGMALHLTGADEIIVYGHIGDFGRGVAFAGIGWPVLAAIALAGVATFIVNQTIIGRQLLALGGSPRSAAESGLPVMRTLLFAYGFTGASAALAGVVLVGRIGGLNPDLGWGFEFTVITAVVLGGTSLFGGRGSIVGSLIGAVLLTTINNGLNLIGADPFIYDVVRGAVLIAAVALDAVAASWRRGRGALLPLLTE